MGSVLVGEQQLTRVRWTAADAVRLRTGGARVGEVLSRVQAETL